MGHDEFSDVSFDEEMGMTFEDHPFIDADYTVTDVVTMLNL